MREGTYFPQSKKVYLGKLGAGLFNPLLGTQLTLAEIKNLYFYPGCILSKEKQKLLEWMRIKNSYVLTFQQDNSLVRYWFQGNPLHLSRQEWFSLDRGDLIKVISWQDFWGKNLFPRLVILEWPSSKTKVKIEFKKRLYQKEISPQEFVIRLPAQVDTLWVN